MSAETIDLDTVVCIAARLHMGQVDKAGQPYILHPLRVMFAMPPDDRDAQIVALLHDVMEDCEINPSDLAGMRLKNKWSAAIIAISKKKGEGYTDYLARVKANPLALRVKLADVADNEGRLSSLPEGVERERLALKYARAREILGAP